MTSMKISALITTLQAAQAEYGDVEVKLAIDGADHDLHLYVRVDKGDA